MPTDLPAQSSGNSGAAAPFLPSPQDPADPRRCVLPPVLVTGRYQGHLLIDDPFQAAFREPMRQLGPLQGGHPVPSPYHRHDIEADGSPATGHQQGQMELLLPQAVHVQRTCNDRALKSPSQAVPHASWKGLVK